MKKNVIRQMLKDKRAVVSTRMWSTWPLFTELVGTTGYYDYVEIVAEYAPVSQMDMENIARAAELHGMGSMIKVDFQNRLFVAQKAVAAGFQSVLFADHHTSDEIRESIRCMKPDRLGQGRYGYPNRRFIGMQSHLSQMDHCERLDEIVLAFMIEKEETMEHIEEICEIPGIDMLQFGPSDFSMSAGKNRDEYKDVWKEAERKMIRTALEHGITPRCEIASPEEAQYYIDLGVRHFSLGDQFKILKKFWEEEGEKMRHMADGIQ